MPSPRLPLLASSSNPAFPGIFPCFYRGFSITAPPNYTKIALSLPL